MNTKSSLSCVMSQYFKTILSLFTFSINVSSIYVSIARRVLFATLCLLLLLTSKASMIHRINIENHLSKYCAKSYLI